MKSHSQSSILYNPKEFNYVLFLSAFSSIYLNPAMEGEEGKVTCGGFK